MNHNMAGGPNFSGRPTSDELAWTAYQYSVGELAEDAALEFEARLELDQAAREALAAAVGCHATVKAALEVEAGELPVVAPLLRATTGAGGAWQVDWRSAACWTSLGAAACLALMFLWQQGRRPSDSAAPIATVQHDADARLLAALDIDLAAADSDVNEDEASPLVAEVADVDAVSEMNHDDVSSFDDPSLDVAAPDWLVAAVFEESAGPNE